MSKQKEWLIGLGIAWGMIVIIILLVSYVLQRKTYEGVNLASGGDKVAVVELLGPITDSESVVRQLKTYGEHGSVKAIVLRIDSPGGDVAAAQEIYEAVRRVRDGEKPVVASMGNVAASGGYYVACGSDTIMANPGTVTGSIGVIAEFPNMQELLKKVGIKFEVVKSGQYKDTGSPYRDITPADRRYLQAFVNDAYEQFVDVVSRERNIARKKVITLADGRIFTGRQALQHGLVDLMGDYEEAIKLAAHMGHIKGYPSIIKERRRRITLFDFMFQQVVGAIRSLSGMTLKYRLY